MDKLKIKPLSWRIFCGNTGNCEANAPFGSYCVQKIEPSMFGLWYPNNMSDHDELHTTMDSAKSAAQKHLEEQIALFVEQ